jgi:hypothetical protein
MSYSIAGNRLSPLCQLPGATLISHANFLMSKRILTFEFPKKAQVFEFGFTQGISWFFIFQQKSMGVHVTFAKNNVYSCPGK